MYCTCISNTPVSCFAYKLQQNNGIKTPIPSTKISKKKLPDELMMTIHMPQRQGLLNTVLSSMGDPQLQGTN